jgi:hypothetical protein|uniref:Glycosyl transferase family 1 domain-containing protein n=1 Tax=viral metagenome TaxID=1070528 RepID=A0A6C0CX86_9ZZZZ
MRFLILYESFHNKNKNGLIASLNYLGWEYRFGNINDIKDFDIIYSPNFQLINPSIYPSKKFIFGPHFSVFPDQRLLQINNTLNNAIYIQPSKWAAEVWINLGVRHIPIKILPFAVNTNIFKPSDNTTKDKVFIYFKNRNPQELQFLELFLKTKNIPYRIFDYVKKYQEEDYLNYLQHSKFGIFLDAHESQGFALEEALSCNVPLLVWNTRTMNQEFRSSFGPIPCTTIPYWDNQCGEYFYDINELEEKYNTLISKLDQYQPRQFILENLSVEKCANKMKTLINI